MAELSGAFAWKPSGLSEDAIFSDDEGKKPALTTPERVSPVVWPPQSPDALGMQRPAATTGSGVEAKRFRKKRGDDKAQPSGGGSQAQHGKGGQSTEGARKREDGWLPKAEYEAKKREERAQRQREREQAGDAGKGGGKGSKSGKGAGRGGGDSLLREGLPKRPDPPKDTPEAQEQREKEDAQIKARDMLRGATTADEMRSAIARAKELGLVEEVRLGERKLAKMTEAA